MRVAHECGKSQGGYVLVVLSIVVAAMMVGLLHTVDSATLRAAQSARTMQALQEAKEALIAEAAMNDTLPGRMSCPEDITRIGTATEGTQASCNNTSMHIGRLPWRSLKLPQFPDGSGEQLWYVLSPDFRSAPINPLTSDGKLKLNDQQGIVAIIFAPGLPLAGQNRPVPTKDNLNANNYLDGTNNDDGDGLHTFSTSPAQINDIAVTITVAELTAPIVGRVLAEVGGSTPQRRGLLRYYDIHGTFPAPLGQAYPYNDADAQPEPTAHSWLSSNNWYNMLSYAQTAADATLSINTSCWTYKIQYSMPTMVGARTRLPLC
jgi:hypothetical protein